MIGRIKAILLVLLVDVKYYLIKSHLLYLQQQKGFLWLKIIILGLPLNKKDFLDETNTMEKYMVLLEDFSLFDNY